MKKCIRLLARRRKPPQFPPENLSPPTVVGIGQVGRTLTAVAGKWTGSPALSHAWRRDEILIGAQAKTYVAAGADHGHFLTVDETAAENGMRTTVTSRTPALGMFSATLGGDNVKLLYSLPAQEANHGHQSSTGEYVSFTVYNRVSPAPTPSNPAIEGNSYLYTGISTLRLADGDVKVRVAADPLYTNCNPAWFPDGSGFVYTTDKSASGKSAIWKYDLASQKSSVVYDPGDINLADFDVGADGAIVAAGEGAVAGQDLNVLYIYAGGRRTQLTRPVSTVPFNPRGDFDPHWSPDQTKVACVRAIEPKLFRIVIITLGPGHTFAGETVLPAFGSPTAFDGVPEWSSDNKTIIFWHTDPSNLAEGGIYWMNPDGAGRTRVNLPANYLYNTVSFVPGGGSSASSKIIYSAGPVPILKAATG